MKSFQITLYKRNYIDNEGNTIKKEGTTIIKANDIEDVEDIFIKKYNYIDLDNYNYSISELIKHNGKYKSLSQRLKEINDEVKKKEKGKE